MGDDEHSQFVLQRFREEGIDAGRVRRQADARPVRSSIIVASGGRTRTLLFDIDGVVGPDSTWPPEDVIRGAKLLLVDHCGVEGMVRAARIAREEGMPVVADLESMDDPLFPALLDLVDHLILSRGFALRLTGKKDAAAAARALWAHGRRAAVVTCGSDGCWFVSDEEPGDAHCQPALVIDAVDTTGCGDVFHGAYAAALVRGMAIPAALRFAAVAAGLKAARRGGQAGIPMLSEVEARMPTASFTHV